MNRILKYKIGIVAFLWVFIVSCNADEVSIMQDLKIKKEYNKEIIGKIYIAEGSVENTTTPPYLIILKDRIIEVNGDVKKERMKLKSAEERFKSIEDKYNSQIFVDYEEPIVFEKNKNIVIIEGSVNMYGKGILKKARVFDWNLNEIVEYKFQENVKKVLFKEGMVLPDSINNKDIFFKGEKDKQILVPYPRVQVIGKPKSEIILKLEYFTKDQKKEKEIIFKEEPDAYNGSFVSIDGDYIYWKKQSVKGEVSVLNKTEVYDVRGDKIWEINKYFYGLRGSPNGEYVIATDDIHAGDFYKIYNKKGEVREIPYHFSGPVFSEDGEWFAFIYDTLGKEAKSSLIKYSKSGKEEWNYDFGERVGYINQLYAIKKGNTIVKRIKLGTKEYEYLIFDENGKIVQRFNDK